MLSLEQLSFWLLQLHKMMLFGKAFKNITALITVVKYMLKDNEMSTIHSH